MQHVPGPILALCFWWGDGILFAFVLISKGNPHLCVYMNIYGTFPTLRPNKVFIHMFLLGGIHFQTGVCLRWLFTFYHSKSPVNHDLGDYVFFVFYFFETSYQQIHDFVTIFISSYWASSAFVHMGLVEPKDE